MIKLEEMDERIMGLLEDDGRMSFREIARRIDVSESAVRQRVKRLQRAKAIRIGVVVDNEKIGRAVASYVRLGLAAAHLDEAVLKLCELQNVGYVATVLGRYNVIAVLLAANVSALQDILDDHISTLPGVNEIDVQITGRTIKHDFYKIALTKT